MALGTTIDVSSNYGDTDAQFVAQSGIVSKWFTVIDAGGADDQDAATITDPAAEITAATRKKITTKGRGNHLALRLVYDDGVSAVTNPSLAVFGRVETAAGTELWERLRTLGNSRTVALAVDTTNDASDGTLNYTDVVLEDTVVDLNGCDEILVGVETAFAATGTVTSAYVQGKIL